MDPMQPSTHLHLISKLQLNYNSLKNSICSVSCKSTLKCGITDEFEVSKLMEVYRNKVLTSKLLNNEKEKESLLPFQTEKSTCQSHISSLFVSFVNKNLGNLSDDTLSNLFADELQKRKSSDEKLIPEILNYLCVPCNNETEEKLNSSINCQQQFTRKQHIKGIKQDQTTKLKHLYHSQEDERLLNQNITKEVCDKTKCKSEKNIKGKDLDDRPHRCIKCNMAFKRKLHLKRHFIVKHTENKNYSCSTCGQKFSRKDYLDKHEKAHKRKNFKLKLLQQGIVVRTKMCSKTKEKLLLHK